jgi:hypothetical protein
MSAAPLSSRTAWAPAKVFLYDGPYANQLPLLELFSAANATVELLCFRISPSIILHRPSSLLK